MKGGKENRERVKEGGRGEEGMKEGRNEGRKGGRRGEAGRIEKEG